MHWTDRLRPRNWAIRWVVTVVPTVSAVVFMAIIYVGLKQSERQFDQLQAEVVSSFAYQQTLSELPRTLENIQSALYKLAILRILGADGAPVDTIKEDVAAKFAFVAETINRLDPRVTADALTEATAKLTRAVDQLFVLVERSPTIATTAVRGLENIFRETRSIAETMSAEAAALLISDLEYVRDTAERATWQLFQALAVAGLILCAGALAVARTLSRPILALARAVEALDKGNLDAHVPAVARQNEIGKVAAAILSFRNSLRENRQLQAERDDLTRNLERKVALRTRELAMERERLAAAQADAERDRQAMTAQLRAEFGQVINAASEGDFSQRVATTFADDNLKSLADDINRFVDRVDCNVTAISEAMRNMTRGEFGSIDSSGFAGAFADIMAQIDETGLQIVEQSNQLTHIALHDALTGLPNRRFLEDRLDAYTRLLGYGDLGIAIMHIDLDRFKEINDTLGHAAGDAVLTKSAQILSALSDNDDFVARVGGDEFVMICPMQYDLDEVAERARVVNLSERIVSALSQPVEIDGQPVRFGASIGVAFSTRDATDLTGLIVDADMALYQAKEAGRNQAQVFSKTIGSTLIQRRTLRDELYAALEADQFVPFFQPKYFADSHRIAGVEALVRWDHPQRGVLTPDHFLAAAEEMDIVKQIDQRILWKSVALLNDLRTTSDIRIPQLSVNVSQQRLYDADLLASLDGLDPPFGISFELLESIFFDDQDDRFRWMLDALRERRIGIEIDDFGSGRASISALINVKPDRLKIDRSLVRPLDEDRRGCQMIKGIVDIARSMNIGITAEGVETSVQADILRDLGCDILQGYAFARPMPAEDLAGFALKKAG